MNDIAAIISELDELGWQIVPIIPSNEMLDAARDWSRKVYGKPIGDEAARGCHAAMTRSAPSPVAVLQAMLSTQHGWMPIETSPDDDSNIWISDGENVWTGTAFSDGSLKLPSRSSCKFWMPREATPSSPSCSTTKDDSIESFS